MTVKSKVDVQKRHHDAHAKLQGCPEKTSWCTCQATSISCWWQCRFLEHQEVVIPGRIIQVVHHHVDAVQSCSVNITLEEEPDKDQEIPTPVYLAGQKLVVLTLNNWLQLISQMHLPLLHLHTDPLVFAILQIIEASLSEPHTDHDNGPRARNNGMYLSMSVSMYHLPRVCCTLVPEIRVRPEMFCVFRYIDVLTYVIYNCDWTTKTTGATRVCCEDYQRRQR